MNIETCAQTHTELIFLGDKKHLIYRFYAQGLPHNAFLFVLPYVINQ